MAFFCIIYAEREKNARFVLLSQIKYVILQAEKKYYTKIQWEK